MADKKAGRVFGAAADGRHVAHCQDPSLGCDGQAAHGLHAGEAAVDPEREARPGRFDKPGIHHRVGPRDRRRDIADAEPQRLDARLVELHEDLLGLFAKDIDLADAGHGQEPGPERLGHAGELPIRQALGLQREQGEIGVGELVVEEGADDAAGQPACLVRQLLAHLVPLVFHDRRRAVVGQQDLQRDEAGPRGGLDAVEPAQLLQALFQRVCDQILHLGGRGARPGRRHHHRPGLQRVGGLADPRQLVVFPRTAGELFARRPQ